MSSEAFRQTVLVAAKRFKSSWVEMGKLLVQVLEQNPDIVKIRIEGHTDNQGKPSSNLSLSKRRAKAVMKWLTKAGVDKKRLESNGYGQTQPIADNDTEDGRAKNRRVMFVVVKGNEAK